MTTTKPSARTRTHAHTGSQDNKTTKSEQSVALKAADLLVERVATDDARHDDADSMVLPVGWRGG
jgi:hypothetical protein